MSEQNFTIYGQSGDTADAAAVSAHNEVPVNFPVSGVNNIDLQIAIQYTTGTATASSGAVTLILNEQTKKEQTHNLPVLVKD